MVFLDFNLPNATTWFYFSLMLAVGLLFKFNRLLSLRNWDLVSCYLLVPGFLFLQHAYGIQPYPNTFEHPQAALWASYGFGWLMAGSLALFIRCLWDMALVSRPALPPNLNQAGLAWFAAALFICMVPIAMRRDQSQQPVGKKPTALDVLDEASTQTVEQVQQLAGAPLATPTSARFWVPRILALLFHAAVFTGLVLVVAVHFGNVVNGMAAGTLYLLLPYTAYHVREVHHVLPAALLVWAVFAYRRPVVCGVLLGVGAGTCFFPALTAPIWLSFYRRSGTKRFFTGFISAAVVTLGLTAYVLWREGNLADSVREVFGLTDWQPWRRSSLPSVWHGVHGAYRLPVFVLHLTLIILTAFWPRPKNLGHVIALSAAVLIGIQFWYADQGGLYVLWYLPLYVLMIFRPNLSDRFPPMIAGRPPLFSRWMQQFVQWLVRRLQPPEPAQTD
ncbi:MAG: hypothetical protein N2039_09775 [Gemmataceae bacterium]|nr:hypothetical protein [Gemmataceae bacterium]